MAIGIHVARVNFTMVDGAGVPVDKNEEWGGGGATIGEMTNFSNEHRVIPDSAIPNTAARPTVKDYLELEAADNYVLHYMDQNTIVTYIHGAGPLP